MPTLFNDDNELSIFVKPPKKGATSLDTYMEALELMILEAEAEELPSELLVPVEI
jgi:hypothetical protein